MAFISTPEQAIQQISQLMKDSDNPNDKGFLVNLGSAVLGAVTHLKKVVELSAGKAHKGTVTVTISLHAFRNAAKEIVCKGSFGISKKLPSEFLKHEGEFFVGDAGELSTSPIARAQEKMFTPAVIEGGAATTKPNESRRTGRAE